MEFTIMDKCLYFRESIRVQSKKKAPRGARGVKGGMDMGYRALVRLTALAARAAMMRSSEIVICACHITPVSYDKPMQERFRKFP